MKVFADAAPGLAAAGFRVFPCAPRGKVPLTAHGCLDATTDEALIGRWTLEHPGANIGVATGRGLVVVDVDGQEGAESLAALVLEHAPGRRSVEIFGTACVATGSGGCHYWYAAPAGVEVRNSAGRLRPGLDVRGDGGYVLAPPSVHPNGRPYRWRHMAWIAPMPEWLLELVRRPAELSARPVLERRRLPAGQAGTRYGLSALEAETAAVRAAAVGTRNDRLNAASFALGQLVAGGELAGAAAVDELEAAALASGLSEGEARRTIRSGFAAGLERPRGARRAA